MTDRERAKAFSFKVSDKPIEGMSAGEVLGEYKRLSKMKSIIREVAYEVNMGFLAAAYGNDENLKNELKQKQKELNFGEKMDAIGKRLEEIEALIPEDVLDDDD